MILAFIVLKEKGFDFMNVIKKYKTSFDRLCLG